MSHISEWINWIWIFYWKWNFIPPRRVSLSVCDKSWNGSLPLGCQLWIYLQNTKLCASQEDPSFSSSADGKNYISSSSSIWNVVYLYTSNRTTHSHVCFPSKVAILAHNTVLPNECGEVHIRNGTKTTTYPQGGFYRDMVRAEAWRKEMSCLPHSTRTTTTETTIRLTQKYIEMKCIQESNINIPARWNEITFLSTFEPLCFSCWPAEMQRDVVLRYSLDARTSCVFEIKSFQSLEWHVSFYRCMNHN